MGLGKQYPKEIIDKIIGLLQVDIKQHGYFKKQAEYDLFRKYIWLEEALVKIDTPERRIDFQNHQMLVYFYQFAKELIQTEHDQVKEYFCQIHDRDLWEQFEVRNPEFKEECNQLNDFVNEIQKKVEQIDLEEKKPEPIMRRTCYQIIRRIPSYSYFTLWKHQWKNCQTHGKFMTLEHIMEHLDSFDSDYSSRVKNIIDYTNNITGSLVKKTQKALTNQMKDIAKVISNITKEHCEKYKPKQPIPAI